MNEEFERLINRFSSEWQEQAKEAIILLQKLLKAGKNLDSAVEMLMKEYPALFTLPELQPALVEAACYGYGIVPKVLTAAMFQQWEADLSKAWASDNMKLSKRLHTASLAMRERIVDTVREQMRRNSSWVQTARALFDGYNADKVINEQALPKYITEVRRATQGSVEQLRAARKAINNIERLAKNGAPTKSLKTAYKNLVETALTGSEEQLNKACWVAIQEKSRYVAERIARTELARAYSDGFFRSVADDEDVVAVKWTLNSGHPVFDICDMYQRADLFGLGAGIYPKDKVPPLPAHPFCLCKLFKVYSLKGKPVDHIRQGGDKWLQGLSDVHQNIVLGIQGAKAWRNGEDWRKYMRSWQGVGKADTRLRPFKFILQLHANKLTDEEKMNLNLIPPTDEFIAKLAKKQNLPYTIGKDKIERFYADNKEAIYPPNNGAVGTTRIITLKASNILVDRYGPPKGSFISLKDTPETQRSLPRISDGSEREHHIYKVIKDIENVEEGITAAWFGEKGGGKQYKLPKRVRDLLGVYLEEVKEE